LGESPYGGMAMQDALNREMYFKTTDGKKAIKYMLNGTLDKMGYAGKKIEMGFESDESDKEQ
jgi:hypothetical protein